jgi:chemotaxis methyl-accepting protein methylase
LHFEESRLDLLASVLQERMSKTGCRSYTEYEKRVAGSAGRGEWAELAEKLTVNETYFFRYADHFRAFAETAMPQRMEARNAERTLRILCAGCASGEEPYSVAILLRERFPDLAKWQVEIRGLDVNRAVLEKARRGRYSPWSLRETPEDVQRRYFRGQGRDFQLVDAVREAVRFEERNLSEEDVLFWRGGTFRCGVLPQRDDVFHGGGDARCGAANRAEPGNGRVFVFGACRDAAGDFAAVSPAAQPRYVLLREEGGRARRAAGDFLAWTILDGISDDGAEETQG